MSHHDLTGRWEGHYSTFYFNRVDIPFVLDLQQSGEMIQGTRIELQPQASMSGHQLHEDRKQVWSLFWIWRSWWFLKKNLTSHIQSSFSERYDLSGTVVGEEVRFVASACSPHVLIYDLKGRTLEHKEHGIQWQHIATLNEEKTVLSGKFFTANDSEQIISGTFKVARVEP